MTVERCWHESLKPHENVESEALECRQCLCLLGSANTAGTRFVVGGHRDRPTQRRGGTSQHQPLTGRVTVIQHVENGALA